MGASPSLTDQLAAAGLKAPQDEQQPPVPPAPASPYQVALTQGPPAPLPPMQRPAPAPANPYQVQLTQGPQAPGFLGAPRGIMTPQQAAMAGIDPSLQTPQVLRPGEKRVGIGLDPYAKQALEARKGPRGEISGGPPSPGAAQQQGGQSNDDALAALLQPSMRGGKGAGGPSKADQAYMGQLLQQHEDLTNAYNDIANQHRQTVQGFADQSAALKADAQTGLAAYQKQMADDDAHMQRLSDESDQEYARTQSQLHSLMAQGIDPEQYYKQRGEGVNIGMAIFAGLAQVQAARTGGANPVLQMIQSGIDRNIDAQKANLAKSIDLAKLSGDFADKRFNTQFAMLKAQRESTQASWAAADAQLQRFMQQNQANATIQQNGQQLQAQMVEARAKQVDALNREMYAVQKAGEKTGAAGPDVAGQVRALAADLYKQSKGALTPDQARRQAARLVIGFDADKGQAEPAAWGAGAGAGKMSPAMAQHYNAVVDTMANVKHLLDLRTKHGGGTFGLGAANNADDNDAAATAAKAQEQLTAAMGRSNDELLKRTAAGIPNDPLATKVSGLWGSDPIGARLHATYRMLQHSKEQMEANPGGSVPAGAGGGDDADTGDDDGNLGKD